MNQSLLVTKRDGHKERIDLDKIHKVITWAAEGLNNVSVSQVELRSQIQFYDGIRTSDIHETMIKAAADLITGDTPDYQYLAARLAIFHLRKKRMVNLSHPHCTSTSLALLKWANMISICWKTTHKKSSSKWIVSLTIGVT